MAKFKISQTADYVTGHIRRAHREGVIEADSIEDAKDKLENQGYDEELVLVVDGYEVDDVEYGDNAFEIEEVEE